ncbi:MAG TPA: VOC family protein [Acidobacteriaceae bacterium]|jgi:predicted 3-demethylubiquinone-9 3-methyltransferase (glyoxalase superfamily)
MPKISPFLWFDNNAEEAVEFYLSVFKDSDRLKVRRSGGPGGKVMVIAFELDGQEFVALNGGPMFKFTEAVSFVVYCKDQGEIDQYWDGLIAGGGAPSQCGWLKDKFGLSWQIVPENISEIASSPAAMQALMGMIKLDIATLEAARLAQPNP